MPHFDTVAGGCSGKCCSLPRSVHGAGHPVEMLRASEVPISFALKGKQLQKCRSTIIPSQAGPHGDPHLLWKLGQDVGVSPFSLHLLADQGMHLSSFNTWVMFSCFFFFSQSKDSDNVLAVCQGNTVAQVSSIILHISLLHYYFWLQPCVIHWSKK